MNAVTIGGLQGFGVYHLNSPRLALAVVPELGARIISLKDLKTQRDWMWYPGGSIQLFRNQPGDDFSSGPLVGIDECLPTILPCTWQGRLLPDHGEVWNGAWEVDTAAWNAGIMKTTISLAMSPLVFERSILLKDDVISMGYTLTNKSERQEHFVWAMHPLLRLIEGDRLELPNSTRQLLNGAGWVDNLAAAPGETNCAKAYAHPLSDGWAGIKNDLTGDSLRFSWDLRQNNCLGLWMTRGGWHGHHHLAIEPTNANDDSLAVAFGRNCCGTVEAKGSVHWQVTIQVGSVGFH